jgi:hypothetical protein
LRLRESQRAARKIILAETNKGAGLIAGPAFLILSLVEEHVLFDNITKSKDEFP